MATRFIIAGFLAFCVLNTAPPATAQVPETVTIGGREVTGVKRFDYRNGRLNVVSSSGMESFLLEEFSIEEFDKLPQSVRKEIEDDLPRFVEGLRATSKKRASARTLTADVTLDQLVLADTTVKNVVKLEYAAGLLKAHHSSGMYVAPAIRLSKSEVSKLPPEFVTMLKADFFFFRDPPSPDRFDAEVEISGKLDEFPVEMARLHRIVVSIDPLMRRGVIPGNFVLATRAVKGAEVLSSLRKTFGEADSRLEVFHISPGLYFVSLKDAEYLQRSMLAFQTGSMQESARWLKLVSTRGTSLHNFLEGTVGLVSESHALSERAATVLNHLRLLIDAKNENATRATVKPGAIEQLNHDLDYLTNRLDPHFGRFFDDDSPLLNDGVPPQLKLPPLDALTGLINQLVEIDKLHELLLTSKDRRFKVYKGFDEQTDMERLTRQLEGFRKHLFVLDERAARYQPWAVTEGASLLMMNREDFDSAKAGVDLSLSNRWDWDNRVFAGSEESVGLLLRDKEFDDIFSADPGKVYGIVHGQRNLVDAFAELLKAEEERKDKRREKTEVEDKDKDANADAPSWLGEFATEDPGYSTGLVVTFESSGVVGGSTSILSARNYEDDSSGTSLYDLVVSKKKSSSSDQILKKIFISGIVSSLDPYSLHSMKNAALWIQSQKGMDQKIPRGGHLLLTFEQGLGLNIGGDSAGGAWAAAIYSELMGRPNFGEVAMTGSIRSSGKIFAVGGIHFKARGAAEKRCVAMFVPEENEMDVMTLPAETLLRLQLITYDNVQQLLDIIVTPPEPDAAKTGSTSSKSTEPPDPLDKMNLSKLSTLYAAGLYYLDQKKYGEANYCLGKLVEAYPQHISAKILLKRLQSLNSDTVTATPIARLIGDDLPPDIDDNPLAKVLAPPPAPPKSKTWWESLKEKLKNVF